MNPRPRKCPGPDCRKGYTPARSWQRFCSIKCRNTYHTALRTQARRMRRKANA